MPYNPVKKVLLPLLGSAAVATFPALFSRALVQYHNIGVCETSVSSYKKIEKIYRKHSSNSDPYDSKMWCIDYGIPERNTPVIPWWILWTGICFLVYKTYTGFNFFITRKNVTDTTE